jgi:hypothetical protein
MRGADPHEMILCINTAYGAIAFMTHINTDEAIDTSNEEEETAPITEQELKILKDITAAEG